MSNFLARWSLVIAVAICVASLALCRTSPPGVDMLAKIRAMPASDPAAVLGPSIVDRTFSALEAPQFVGASVSRLDTTYGGCRSKVGTPMVWETTADAAPWVGRRFVLQWTTLSLAAPREWPAFVIASIWPLPEPIDLACNGCQLEVAPDVKFFPGGDPANIVHRLPGSEGYVTLAFTPDASSAGVCWYMQLVVLVPLDVSPCGVLLSPGVRICVGARGQ